jgi:hypothetical protein
MPSTAARRPNTTFRQFSCDLPQRRTADHQIGKRRMEVLSTLNRRGFVCWRKPFRTVAAKSDAASFGSLKRRLRRPSRSPEGYRSRTPRTGAKGGQKPAESAEFSGLA